MQTMLDDTALEASVLERQGCPLHYWVGGPQGRPWVVFSHGLCVDHRSWNAVLPAVIGRYRVLTWDVRGHGLSQPVGEKFSVPLGAEDLLALLDRLGIQKAVLVGHSNGTYLHQELVFHHPERVQALVMADGTCITWKRSAFERWITRNAWRFMVPYPFEALKKASLPSGSARREVQAYMAAAFSMIARRDFLALNAGMGECLHYEPGYRITQPMLLVHGDQDKMGDIARIAPQWAAREPNCRYEVIPDARHFAILDNPDYFNRLLLDFLAQWAV